jgi:hypothetical protein
MIIYLLFFARYNYRGLTLHIFVSLALALVVTAFFGLVVALQVIFGEVVAIVSAFRFLFHFSALLISLGFCCVLRVGWFERPIRYPYVWYAHGQHDDW